MNTDGLLGSMGADGANQLFFLTANHAFLFCDSINLQFQNKNLIAPRGTLIWSILQQCYQSMVFKTYPFGWREGSQQLTHTAPREDLGLASDAHMTTHNQL